MRRVHTPSRFHLYPWAWTSPATESAGRSRASYTVWAAKDGEASAAVKGDFSILPLGIAGVPAVNPMDLQEAATTGMVVEITGEPGAMAAIIASNGGNVQMAMVPLDEHGRTVQRIRILQPGNIALIFANYTDGFAGPPSAWLMTVTEHGETAGTWGPGSGDGDIFELSNP